MLYKKVVSLCIAASMLFSPVSTIISYAVETTTNSADTQISIAPLGPYYTYTNEIQTSELKSDKVINVTGYYSINNKFI